MEYATFAKFYGPGDAEPLIHLLRTHQIPFKTLQERNQADALIIGNSMDMLYAVAIPAESFTKVRTLVDESLQQQPAIESQYLRDEYVPERLSPGWICCGYLISCFALVGIFAGVTLANSTKRLSNGNKVQLYDEYTRKHGRIMIALGILATLWVLYRRLFVM